MSRLGDYLKAQRDRRGLTQGVLAKELGISQGAVCQYELGTIVPRAGRLVALAEVLGVPEEDLFALAAYDEPRLAQPESKRYERVDEFSRLRSEPRHNNVNVAARMLADELGSLVDPTYWSSTIDEFLRIVSQRADEARQPGLSYPELRRRAQRSRRLALVEDMSSEVASFRGSEEEFLGALATSGKT